MTWGVDLATTARSDLVGLDPDHTTAIIDTLVRWGEVGPPRTGRRVLAGVEFYESQIAKHYLVAYVIDDARRRFALLWLRERPGSPSG